VFYTLIGPWLSRDLTVIQSRLTWLSNSTAQAMALARVKPEVLLTIPLSLSHFSLVTCLATKLWVDLILGNSAMALKGNNVSRFSSDFENGATTIGQTSVGQVTAGLKAHCALTWAGVCSQSPYPGNPY